MTRTVRDAAILFDVMVGYDRNDSATALSVGRIPETYTSSLLVDDLRGARIGVIREPMNANTNSKADDYGLVRAVVDRAIARLQELEASDLRVDVLVYARSITFSESSPTMS